MQSFWGYSSTNTHCFFFNSCILVFSSRVQQMSEQKRLPEIFWSQQFGNKYLVNSRPEMLTGEVKVLRSIKLPPFYYSQPKERCFVIYDRDYVVEKLMHEFVEPLEGVKYQELQTLLSEAWKKFKDGK